MNQQSEPTVLPFIVFSDGLIREQGTGKITMIGTFEFFNAPSFPFQSPPFFATIGITNIHLSRGVGEPETEVNVNIRVEDPKSGHIFGNATGKIGLMEGKTLPRETVIPLPLPMPPMTFNEPGAFNVVLHVDNEKLGERKLRIIAVSAATMP